MSAVSVPQANANAPRPKANTLYFVKEDFKDVENIASMTHEELENASKSDIAKYCEYLIRSAENSSFILKKFISKADLTYVNASTGDNLLNIAILSGNFKPIDVLLEHKCPRDVANNRGYTAEAFVALNSCHKTVKAIFKKYPLDVKTEEQNDISVHTTVETTPV